MIGRGIQDTSGFNEGITMFKNYIKSAIRNLVRYKAYTIINISGLAIGMAACLLIMLYIRQEMSYDRFHHLGERIYRLNKISTPTTGGSELHAISAGKMGPALEHDYPEVEQALRVLPWFGDVLMEHGDIRLEIPDVLFADRNFFSFFDFRLLEGDPETALSEPQSIVLTQETAQIFFGDTDPVGEQITGYGDLAYTVTGIVENAPPNTHLRYDALVSWATTVPGFGALNMNWMNNWRTQAVYTYLLLNKQEAVSNLEAKLPAFMQKYMPDRVEQYHLYLQPMQDIHLKSADIQYSRNLNLGNITYVKIFAASGLLILIIACINFINLATAQVSRRGREVGVRKVLGAVRRQIALQFLGEAVMISFLALVAAIALVELILPVIEQATGQQLPSIPGNNLAMFLGLGVIWLLVALSSGIYPALVLSRFLPVRILRGDLYSGKGGSGTRKLLVTTQFAVSLVLIMCTIVIYNQMNFVRNKNMGFHKDGIIVLPVGNSVISDKYQAFKSELRNHPDILSVAGSQSVPGGGSMSFTILPEGKPETENWQADIYPVDYDFLKTYKLEMTEGRYFSRDFTTDVGRAVIINQTLQKSLGWSDPVGRRLDIHGETEGARVIGVVRDFNIESLHHPVDPVIMYIDPSRIRRISVRIAGSRIQETLDFIASKWGEFEKKYPFEYTFLDKTFENFYLSDRQTLRTLGIFSVLALSVAGLGLFGLASYAVERRSKEIGIRKITGARPVDILLLFLREFINLIFLAMLFAAPAAYLLAGKWLEGFAFRAFPVWWLIFLLAGLTVMLFTVLTVGTKTLRAALTNPVNALRYE